MSKSPPPPKKTTYTKCIVSLLFTILMTYLTTAPINRMYNIRSQPWVRTPCTIIESSVYEFKQGKSYFYGFNIKYSYSWRNKQYTSKRYRPKWTSHFENKSIYFGKKTFPEHFVKQHPKGTKTYCYVNAKDPSKAVIDLSLRKDDISTSYNGVFLLLFLTIFLFFRTYKKKRKEKLAR